ncbi:hypothetical protein N7475_000422 [Penicillium sp. IBT 31633x]|nr:hypothetical protein N7475_000422 [Penicillium sp. IBT 31633x]
MTIYQFSMSNSPHVLEHTGIIMKKASSSKLPRDPDGTRAPESQSWGYLHLNLGGWICAPHGFSPISPSTGWRHCAYCHCPEPSNENLEQHNHTHCLNARRTFHRKDHLVQYLKRVHYVDAIPAIDEWKVEGPTVTSRCGFCDRRLETWDRRIDHLAQHFREGATIKNGEAIMTSSQISPLK